MAQLDFTEWFVNERIRRGWSQEYLANKIGYTRAWISVIENKSKLPTKSFVIGVAYAFSVDTEQALDFAGLGDRPRSVPPESLRPFDLKDLSEEQYEAVMAFKSLLQQGQYLIGTRPKRIDIDSSKPYIFELSHRDREKI